MPGMGTSLQTSNQTVVSAFESALLRQALFVIVILGVMAIAWNVLRSMQIRRAVAAGGAIASPVGHAGGEPAARRFLRITFGCLWVFDGILQAQVSMPLGLPSGIVQPATDGSPGWVHHLVNFGTTIWNNHPVPAAAAAVWIQVGIGLWLLVAPRGKWSRAGGLASVGWGLVVWVFGEAFGSIFSPGVTWLFGAPGGVIFYVAAGALIALPERNWARARLGKAILGVTGAFFVGMAVLQAWPGRGFWQGHPVRHSAGGTLTAMVNSMAQTSQPGFLSSWVSSFASFDSAHGWGVNLFAVAALGLIGAAFLTGRRPVVFPAVIAATGLCLADWVLIEDFGFFGGLGTDPNSMIPIILIFVAGYVAMTRVPAVVEQPVMDATSKSALAWRERVLARPTYAFRALAAIGAIAVTLLGAAPMALAATNPHADPILNEAIDGNPVSVDLPATPFTLTDQNGAAVSLHSLRGRVVALTFLDPVCTTDCPLIAQEFHDADRMLGSDSGRTVFVAIVANPVYDSVAITRAFDQTEGLSGVKNWLFLTGPEPTLKRLWSLYGVQVSVEPAGAMVAHSDIAFVIDGSGHTRYVLNADPGPGTEASQSSFSGVVTMEIRRVLGAS